MHSSKPQTSIDDATKLLTIIPNKSTLATPSNIRIGDLIRRKQLQSQRFFGIEIVPTIFGTADAELDLNTFPHQPLFISIPWFGNQFQGADAIEQTPAFQLARTISPNGAKPCGVPVLRHLTCERMQPEAALIAAQGGNNVLALRGDTVDPQQPMRNASTLVRHIRQNLPDTSIAVAGYPDRHPESSSQTEDIHFLKQKIDNGADYIITQVCFSADTIVGFIRLLRENQVLVPVVVGLYVPISLAALTGMCRRCQVTVDATLLAEYEARAEDAEAFEEFAVQEARAMMTRLSECGDVAGFQIFSLNRFGLVRRCVEGFEF